MTDSMAVSCENNSRAAIDTCSTEMVVKGQVAALGRTLVRYDHDRGAEDA